MTFLNTGNILITIISAPITTESHELPLLLQSKQESLLDSVHRKHPGIFKVVLNSKGLPKESKHTQEQADTTEH